MPGNVSPVADERDGLLSYLTQQRQVLRFSAYGLTDEQARTAPTASALCVGGLIKHVAITERGWIDMVLRQPPRPDETDYFANFQLAQAETLAGVFELYDEVARRTEAVIAEMPELRQPV